MFSRADPWNYLPGGEKQDSEEGSSELLSPCEDPAQTMQSALEALRRANASQRIDLEWRAQNQVPPDCLPHPFIMLTITQNRHIETSLIAVNPKS